MIYTLIIHKPNQDPIIEEFADEEKAARRAGNAARLGYIVEMNGKKYVPTTLIVPKEK